MNKESALAEILMSEPVQTALSRKVLSKYTESRIAEQLTKKGHDDYFDLELTDGDARVSVSLRFKPLDGGYAPKQDEETGDWFYLSTVTTALNWSSFNADVAQAACRLTLMTMAFELARSIESQYRGIVMRDHYMTKAEHEESEVKRLAHSQGLIARRLTELLRKGMRQNKRTPIPRSFVAELPDGRYEFHDDNHRERRTFALILKNGSAVLVRMV